MNLGMTDRLKPIHSVATMVRDEIMPLGEEFLAEVGGRRSLGLCGTAERNFEGLKKTARSAACEFY
jgi:acyl-CoA dehydrogenase